MLEKYNDGTLESFSESYNENMFNKLDDEFSDEESGFDSLLEVYIRKSESVYGDQYRICKYWDGLLKAAIWESVICFDMFPRSDDLQKTIDRR